MGCTYVTGLWLSKVRIFSALLQLRSELSVHPTPGGPRGSCVFKRCQECHIMLSFKTFLNQTHKVCEGGLTSVSRYTGCEGGRTGVSRYTGCGGRRTSISGYTGYEGGRTGVSRYTVCEEGRTSISRYTGCGGGRTGVSRYTGCEGGRTSISRYTGCEGGRKSVSRYTGCEGGQTSVLTFLSHPFEGPGPEDPKVGQQGHASLASVLAQRQAGQGSHHHQHHQHRHSTLPPITRQHCRPNT